MWESPHLVLPLPLAGSSYILLVHRSLRRSRPPTMASKLLNLIALSSLAILACSFGATPVNALSVDSSVHARSLGHHNLVAKKKRAESRRCKPRPASTSTTTTVSTTSKAPTAPSTQPNPPPPPAPAPPPSTGGGGGKVGLAWNNGNQNNLGNFVTKKVGWYVNSLPPPAALKFIFLLGPTPGAFRSLPCLTSLALSLPPCSGAATVEGLPHSRALLNLDTEMLFSVSTSKAIPSHVGSTSLK